MINRRNKNPNLNKKNLLNRLILMINQTSLKKNNNSNQKIQLLIIKKRKYLIKMADQEIKKKIKMVQIIKQKNLILLNPIKQEVKQINNRKIVVVNNLQKNNLQILRNMILIQQIYLKIIIKRIKKIKN